MNLIELKKAVASLMFETDVDDNTQFFQSVNRAIYRARMSFPKVKSYRIAQFPIKNILGENHNQVYANETNNVFDVKDLMSFSFEALGKGSLVVTWYNKSNAVLDYEEICTVDFDSPNKFTTVKGFAKRFDAFMKGDFRLKFQSDFQFQVKNVGLYNTLKSINESDIDEFSELTAYDLKSLTNEYGKLRGESQKREVFMGLTKSPQLILGDEHIPIPFKFADGVLEVPRKYVGEIAIEYVCEPETVGDGSSDLDEIDVPRGICDSLAYLVASNLILDDDREKSNYYLSMFSEAESNALKKAEIGNQIYQNTANWAG